MNRKQYKYNSGKFHQARYAKVLEQMDLLGIMDISTTRQSKNGTIVWKLPIKNYNSGKTNIEVASFKSGYVRNQNGGYTNYQLNKRCESEPQYYPEREITKDFTYGKKTGKYIKYTTRGCKLIPNELDRLEYLIAYCLKNYFIKRTNEVADGAYVSKWYHEYQLERQPTQVNKIKNLENKLATIEKIANDRNK